MMITGTDLAPFVHGAGSCEPGEFGGVVIHRLPAWARGQVEDQLFSYAESCPTGVWVRVNGASGAVTFTLAATTVAAVGGDAVMPRVISDVDGERTVHTLASATVIRLDGANLAGIEPAPPASITLDAGGREVALLLPHQARVELVAIEGEGDLFSTPPSGKRWLHYGSSISQGMYADNPASPWPLQAADALGWNLRNLSFAGNAQLDGFAARMIRDSDAELITIKIGINLVNADSMRARAFRPALHSFLDTIREKHESTPILVISANACPIHEDAAGPVVAEANGQMHTASRNVEQDQGALTLSLTREIVADVVQSRATTDDALFYLDGRELFGEADAHLLYDKLHPNQQGLDLIAERFIAHARENLAG